LILQKQRNFLKTQDNFKNPGQTSSQNCWTPQTCLPSPAILPPPPVAPSRTRPPLPRGSRTDGAVRSVPVGPCKTVAPSLSRSFSSSSPLVIFPQRPELFRPLRFMAVAHQRCRPARACLAKGKLFVLLSMVSFISSSISSIRLFFAVLPQLR
jgi:hypothetical protein